MKVILFVFMLGLIKEIKPWLIYPDVDCEVSSWSDWTACSQSCGDEGTQRRRRIVTKQKVNSGNQCPHLYEIRKCNRKCCPVDCVLSWGSWGPCTGCGNSAIQKSLPGVGKKAECGGSCKLPPPRQKGCISSQ